MLSTLRIENLAIIDHLELDFAPGLNVLTGETGAGKSIIVGALGLVLGARATTETIRRGADGGQVEAIFDVSRRPGLRQALEDAGLGGGGDEDGGELLVRRVLSRTGRSRVYINGCLATLQTLAAVVGPAVDVTSQHEQHSLLHPANHLALLDRFGALGEEREAYSRDYRRLLALRRDRERLVTDETERALRQDYLRFQLDEIDGAELAPGEDETLRSDRNKLRNAEELRGSASAAEHMLYEDEEAIVTQLGRVHTLLARLADLDEDVAPLAARVDGARVELEDVTWELRSYRDGIEADPGRLAELDERFELVRRLCRKHGPTVDAVLERREDLAGELDAIRTADERRGALEAEIAAAERSLLEVARRLSERRREVARRLERSVREGLSALAMEQCRLRVSFGERPSGAAGLSEDGVDQVELLVETNAGEGFAPLARIASGGELSRILLAAKRALTGAHDVATHIFDEVDAGVGGTVAEAVGKLLSETAHHHQVLCVTHQPQVACFGERHFHVGKTERDGRTVTEVRTLEEGDRAEEVARMLGGSLTAKSRAHAEEMLRAASRSR